MTTEQKAPVAPKMKAEPESLLAGDEPVILDMGKKSRKSVRKLKKGKPGRLMSRVEDAIEHLRQNDALPEGVRPVLIIVRQKGKKRKGRRVAKMWGLG